MKIYLLLLVLITLASCSENSNSPAKSDIKMTDSSEAGLIIVVESIFLQSQYTEVIFQLYKPKMLEILSDMFSVDKSLIENMTMSEIIEEYGEDWQISELKKIANKFYKNVVILTDSTATRINFVNAIDNMARNGQYVDIVLSLHGSKSSIVFSDGSWDVYQLNSWLQARHQHIRSLNQTCCYAYYHFHAWKATDICAINGAIGNNGINIFSPIYFLEEWTAGKPFNEAISLAFTREIEKLKTYNNILPIEEYFLDQNQLSESKQFTGGLYDKLLWKEFPIDFKNTKLD
jgi:hypothetical protein